MNYLKIFKRTALLVGGTLLLQNGFAQLSPVASVTATAAIADAPVVKQDPKDGFKNLFTEDAAKSASVKNLNTEHLNPNAISFVEDYVDRHADQLNGLRSWAKPYFDMMDDVLTSNGIPKELKYLAVIESNLRATAVSWAGAVGPWQFMPATGRRWGLEVSRGRDQRSDYLKSTQAASKYLNYLYNIYKDWLLVVAAYNCGPGRVNSAIQRAGSDDFWDLQYNLPAESRNHVKKFIATHYIMEGKGGVATVTKDQQALFVKDETTNKMVKVQTITGRYNSKAVAKYLDMSIAEFAKLNPSMDKILASNSTYQLKLPLDKADLFQTKKNEMLNESIQMLLNPEYRN